MLAFHLLMSVMVGLSVAVASLSQGYSGLHSLGVGILGGVVGLVGSAGLAWGRRWRSYDQISLQDDPLVWHRMVKTAVDQSSQGTNPQVIRYPTQRRTLADLARGENRHQRPDQALAAESWPEELPEDLHMRLLHVMSYDGCGTDEVWAEVRLWLGHHGVGRPARWQDRPDDAKRRA